MRTSHRLTATAAAVLLTAGAAGGPASAATHHYQDLRMPDTRDVAEGRVPSTSVPPVVIRVDRGSGTGLSWDSAAIGALAGAGLLVSASGGLLLVRRRMT